MHIELWSDQSMSLAYDVQQKNEKKNPPSKNVETKFHSLGLPGSNLSIRPKMVPCQVSQLSVSELAKQFFPPEKKFSWKERVFFPTKDCSSIGYGFIL